MPRPVADSGVLAAEPATSADPAAAGAVLACAWASVLAKLVAVDAAVELLAAGAAVLAAGGSNAVLTLAMSDWIWAIRETESV
jgi:hypothetical protein